MVIDIGFRADLLIEDKVIVELKATEKNKPVHYRQLLTYLKSTDMWLGILINFGDVMIKRGVKRIVNNLAEG